MVPGYYWKLTVPELRALVPTDAERIMAAARRRKLGRLRGLRLPFTY